LDSRKNHSYLAALNYGQVCIQLYSAYSIPRLCVLLQRGFRPAAFGRRVSDSAFSACPRSVFVKLSLAAPYNHCSPLLLKHLHHP
jgi:hypothetical protein